LQVGFLDLQGEREKRYFLFEGVRVVCNRFEIYEKAAVEGAFSQEELVPLVKF